MRNFQDTSETHKRSFISAFPICMTVPINLHSIVVLSKNKDIRKTVIKITEKFKTDPSSNCLEIL